MNTAQHKQNDFFNYTDIICFSHLRWGFVFQRPQHLLTRFAKVTRVFYIEEPIFYDGQTHMELTKHGDTDLFVLVPYLQHGIPHYEVDSILKRMVDDLIDNKNIDCYCAWYYTPMALSFTSHLRPTLVVFDCMDELSSFKFAPPELKERERQLLERADVVFTGGYSIYEAKKDAHQDIHPFPSSIDKQHFGKARNILHDPHDQQNIPHPRFGFFGVVDERFDSKLIEEVAIERPNWHFVIIGPVVKIDPQMLPRLGNIHYLGSKNYKELPHYLAGWDVAVIPFANNESTRFISPTKTPEYLAGGKPVISTPIRDVINPYGNNNLVHIAATASEFINAAETELQSSDKTGWLVAADDFLKDNSWDNTWDAMVQLMAEKMHEQLVETA